MNTDPSEDAKKTPDTSERLPPEGQTPERPSNLGERWFWSCAVSILCILIPWFLLVVYRDIHDRSANVGEKGIGASPQALSHQGPAGLQTSPALEPTGMMGTESDSVYTAVEEDVELEEMTEAEKDSIVAECLTTTGGVDAVTGNTEQVISQLASESNPELAEHARKVFAQRNDPAFKADAKLTEVANSVASFYLHYPTCSECEHLTNLCSELVSSSDYPESILLALEGSRQIFEDEITMMGRGYTRYGRVWVNSNTLARINVRLAQRRKEIEEYLAGQADERRLTGISTNKRTIVRRRASLPIGSQLKAPNRHIRRIGEDSDYHSLKEPDRKIRRIGEDSDYHDLKEPDRKIRRIGEETNLDLKGPDHPVKRIGEDSDTN
jgi:hypothetical protein